jgi:hypothetical protein
MREYNAVTDYRRQTQQPDLLAQLRRLYGKAPLRPDSFGARAAMPSEVHHAIRTARSGAHPATRDIHRPASDMKQK